MEKKNVPLISGTFVSTNLSGINNSYLFHDSPLFGRLNLVVGLVA